MNGLFPKEELAAERWIVLCRIGTELCLERNIKKSDYYPNQHSKNINEKTLGIALSNYRQGISQKGTTCQYECVDFLINKNGFEHWLVFKTDQEKAAETIAISTAYVLVIGAFFSPYLPQLSNSILSYFGLSSDSDTVKRIYQ